MSDEQLSQIFKRDLPNQGDGRWADDARRRHGRRRAGIGGVAVVAALAVVSPFALNQFDNSDDTAVPAPLGTEPATSSPLAPADREAACAGAAENAVDELPETAERLWLCDEPGGIGAGRKGPQEPLTVGVDEALAAFHALEAADPNQACTMEYTLTYVVVAEAADGTMTPVSGGLHGCRTVGNRSGADGYLATLGDLWAAQRAAVTPPAERLGAERLCAVPTSILPTSIDGATQAAICAPGGYEDAPANGVDVPAELLEQIRADIAENTASGTLGEWEPTATLVLADPWGDTLVLNRFASGTYQWDDQVWRPEGALAEMLDALVEQLDLPATEPMAPLDTDCSEARAAVETTGATIEGDVSFVTICVENREGEPRWKAPDMGVVDPSRIREAVEAFNDLPELVGECDDLSRADVFVEYRSQTGLVGAVRVTSCGPATGAVAKDGDGFIKELIELTRDPATAGAMHYAPQELCPQMDSLVAFDPTEEDAAQVVACVGAQGELPVDLSPDVVEKLAADIEAGPMDDTLGIGEEGTLVWMNRYGDPMTLIRAADGSFVWPTSDGTRRWVPSPELKEQLDRIFNL